MYLHEKKEKERAFHQNNVASITEKRCAEKEKIERERVSPMENLYKNRYNKFSTKTNQSTMQNEKIVKSLNEKE